MNTHFHQQRNTRTRRQQIGIPVAIVIGIIALGVVLTNDTLSIPASIRTPLHNVAAPLLGVRTTAETHLADTTTYATSKARLIADNKRLQSEVDTLRAALLDAATIAYAYTNLITTLGHESALNDQVVASVIARSNHAPYDTLIVDIGDTNALAPGDAVFAFDSILIGTVAEVFARSARIELITAPSRETDVLVGTSSVIATAVGRGSGNFLLTLPNTVPVTTGDIIHTPGIVQHTIGIVDTVDFVPGDAFQTVYFRTPINLNTLQLVQIKPKQ